MMMDIQQIALEREQKRSQERQQKIKELISNKDTCFQSESEMIERLRKQQILRAEENHRLLINQINTDADKEASALVGRYLSRLDTNQPNDDEELIDKLLSNEGIQ